MKNQELSCPERDSPEDDDRLLGAVVDTLEFEYLLPDERSKSRKIESKEGRGEVIGTSLLGLSEEVESASRYSENIKTLLG